MEPNDANVLFGDVGDVKSAVTPYLLRYDLVKDVMIEGTYSLTQGDD